MIATTVTIYVKEEHVGDFIAASMENHKGSVKEPGNIRFDLLQCRKDPTRFLLFEVFESEEAIAAHKQTPHYLKWRQDVEPFMAKPREGIAHNVLAPAERDKW